MLSLYASLSEKPSDQIRTECPYHLIFIVVISAAMDNLDSLTLFSNMYGRRLPYLCNVCWVLEDEIR